jgi:predicted enzyme related to lactoylglutathione lyase
VRLNIHITGVFNAQEEKMDRNAALTRLAAVLIETARPEELAEFYRQGFGLDRPKYSGSDHLGLNLANMYLGFDRVPEKKRARTGSVSLWFRVNDLPVTFDRLVNLGATVISPPSAQESPGEILALLADPEGNKIGLICQA